MTEKYIPNQHVTQLIFHQCYTKREALECNNQEAMTKYIQRQCHKMQFRHCKAYQSTKFTDVYDPDENIWLRSRNSDEKRLQLRHKRGALSVRAQLTLGLNAYTRPIEYKNFLQKLIDNARHTRPPYVMHIISQNHETQPMFN